MEQDRLTHTGFRRSINMFDRTISFFENLFYIGSAIILFVMIFVVGYGVVGRAIFHFPVAWTVEVTEYAMIYLTFLATPWILKMDGHVQVDILLGAVNERTRKRLGDISNVLGAVSCLILFWYSLEVVIDHYQRDTIMYNILQLPKYLVLLPIPIGSLFLALRFIRKMMPSCERP